MGNASASAGVTFVQLLEENSPRTPQIHLADNEVLAGRLSLSKYQKCIVRIFQWLFVFRRLKFPSYQFRFLFSRFF
ncbi:hypothetical protein M5D96_004781, partial [Drosophila gunungcola]